jgi:glutathione S-transferase
MKLYTFPISSNARRVRLVAHHLGIPLEEQQVNLAKGEQRQPAYLAINPKGKVPTLVDGELKLTESYAIMVYLCERTGKRALYPEDLASRTEVNRWLFWSASEWGPAVGRFNLENMVKPMLGGTPDPERLREAETVFAPLTKLLDDQLSQHKYLTGPALTLADFAVVAGLATAAQAKLPIAGFSHIQRWFAEIQQLPAWQATASVALP